ncbi:leucine-rich repeat domain-containing protein [Hufsiella ginkgonis]|uniref:TIR domain-containing protein n=1 Tax=Hufsiella ginkgonis TaxID=2695274 RepID=A0A7K1Y350_9SPHI|nr:leucine-rich repeat domain-containing protein [Hufsiella ginkgonis]MXV17723.1 TIR domain-containing protein [Hufsiella ginkgonis]
MDVKSCPPQEMQIKQNKLILANKDHRMKINFSASKLDLSNQNLKEVPAIVFKYKNLKKLNLSNNQIQVLPKELAKCKRLTNLDLSDNFLKTLYAKHFDLIHLEVLILNNNMLKGLPKQIGNIKKLKKLSVSGNKISSLPNEISSLQSLESLNLADNDFVHFPDSILALKSLKRIWLNNNQFQDFPTGNIKQQLPSLLALYCFSSLNKTYFGIDPDYLTLQKYKGNSIGKINLLALKSENQPKLIDVMGIQNGESKQKAPKTLFISYSHQDEEWLKKINVFLDTLQYEGLQLNVWDDTRINTGDRWKDEIEKALLLADIAILIVSSDFLRSRFVREKEVPVLLKKAQDKGAAILPIIAKRCRFTTSPIGEYQSINKPEEPLNALEEYKQDDIFFRLTEEIVRILKL